MHVERNTMTASAVLDRELSRFFEVGQELFIETGESALMPTCVVDEHWHGLIENNELEALVSSHLGDTVAVEHIENGGIDPLNWVDRYEAKFGPLDPAWFTGEAGLDRASYDAYTSKGIEGLPKMSWDCTPAFVEK